MSLIIQPKRRLTVLSAIVLLGLLSGCSPLPKGGQSQDSARAQVLSIEGVQSANINAGGSYNGFQRQTGVIVTVRLAPTYSVIGIADLAEYLARLGWSVNVEEPNEYLTFRVEGISSWALESAFNAAGWDLGRDVRNHFVTDKFVYIAPKVIRAKLGPWPGPVPEVPKGMIVADTNTGP